MREDSEEVYMLVNELSSTKSVGVGILRHGGEKNCLPLAGFSVYLYL